ncbi:alpha/beta fold hydrolase [Mesopusillimonas faecipullorum]|nr:alpha/beta hydrolase [Mesopusillimonas faecipullorum]
MQPRLESVTCANPMGMHRMAYWEWGTPDNDQVVLCVHGLTRSGRDFDVLAQHLAGRYRVVCPDIVGRGHSDWLPAGAPYGFVQYVSDILTLLARLNPRRLVWVGTSMGGLIALSLLMGLKRLPAAHNDAGLGLPENRCPQLHGLLLNDVGPEVDAAGLARIATYVAEPTSFADFEQAVQYVRTVAAGFGPHDEAQWQALTRHVFVKQGDHYIKHYDLRIAEGLGVSVQPAVAEMMKAGLWQAYQDFQLPVLIVRGEHSDILPAELAERMRLAQPRAQLAEFAGVGHAPTLMQADQLVVAEAFVAACMGAQS